MHRQYPIRWTFPSQKWLLVCTLLVLFLLASLPASLVAQSVVRISDIQGVGASSPLRERYVDTFGIVTALTNDGFYLQDPIGDGDVRSSDGIYVYLNRAPKVRTGDCVFVTRAYVDEFYEKTELSRLKSIEPSDRCHSHTITAIPIPLAHLYSDPQTLFEAFEGMLVQVDQLEGVVQGSTKRFASGDAELALIPDPAYAEVAGGRVFQSQAEQSAALIFVANLPTGDLPDARWGDRVAIGAPSDNGRSAQALLDFNFGKYQLLLLPDQPVTVIAQPPPQPEQAKPTTLDEVTICSTNLWALGRGTAQHPNPIDFNQEVKKRAKAIAETLLGCTIIGMQELGTEEAIDALASELRASYGLDYAAWAGSGYQSDNPEFPLTTGFLTLKDRVEVSDVEMLQSCSPTDYEVMPGEMTCAEGEFLLFDRPSLLLDVTVRGNWTESYRLHLVSNHLKSKGGDENINRLRRIEQAKIVAKRAQKWLDEDANAQVVIMGDLNDYYGSEPVETLRSLIQPALYHPYDLLPYLDRYTYVFNGASQVLDHMLLSPALRPQIAEVNLLHINSNFAYPEEIDLSTVLHASDHDPVLLRLRPAGASTLGGNLHFAGIEATLTDAAGTILDHQKSDDLGVIRFWNLATGRYTLHLTLPLPLSAPTTELTLDLVPGENQIPPIIVKHNSLELLRAIFETTPALLTNLQK